METQGMGRGRNAWKTGCSSKKIWVASGSPNGNRVGGTEGRVYVEFWNRSQGKERGVNSRPNFDFRVTWLCSRDNPGPARRLTGSC